MRKTLGVSLLVLLLSGLAVAGEIPNDKPAPPPQPASTAQEPTGSEMPFGIMPNDATVTLMQTTLQLLAVLL